MNRLSPIENGDRLSQLRKIVACKVKRVEELTTRVTLQQEQELGF